MVVDPLVVVEELEEQVMSTSDITQLPLPADPLSCALARSTGTSACTGQVNAELSVPTAVIVAVVSPGSIVSFH